MILHGAIDETASVAGRKRSDRNWESLSPVPFRTVSLPSSPSFDQQPVSAVSFPAVISQEIEMEEKEACDHESLSHSSKRARTRAWQSQILRDTCLGMRRLENETGSPPAPPSSPKRGCSQRQKWWEQAPQSANPESRISPSKKASCGYSCFVCQKNVGPINETSSPDESAPKSGKQFKSILSYFGQSSHTPDKSGHQVNAVTTNADHGTCDGDRVLQDCAFCDHSVCHSCVRKCEGCFQNYCTFCSTTNYSGPVERYFCLECEAAVSSESCSTMDLS